ncbi:MAG: hypothetical protein IJS15_07260 [Victivallales bacterium]|nr:hypothetical protein [Victivallales bacterium]
MLKLVFTILLSVSIATMQLAVHGDESDSVGRQEIRLDTPGDWCKEGQKPIMDAQDGVYSLDHSAHLFCTHTFKVQRRKRYSFFVEMRTDDDIKSHVNAAFVVCTELRRPIPAMQYLAASDSMAQLAAPTVEDQNFIIVGNNPKWLELFKNGHKAVAFGAKEDMSDLPNAKVSTQIRGIEPDGDNLKVSFEKRIFEEFPAGTKVRLHKIGSFFKPIESAPPQKEWRRIGGVMELPANAEFFFPCVIFYTNKGQFVQLRNFRLIVE